MRHHLALSIVGTDAAPFGYYAGKLAQERLVAAREVAEHLVDLAGPRPERMAHLARRWVRAMGTRVRVVELPGPGGLGQPMRDGTLLPGPGAVLGTQTFDEWLAETGAGP